MSGLQSVVCGLTMSFAVVYTDLAHGHCVTISTIGTTHPTVHIYNSLYTSAGAKLKAQIACLLCTEQSEINLKFLDVPINAVCGLCAIALGSWKAATECYVFDQQEMRAHLRKCLLQIKMTMFPFKKPKRSKIRSMQPFPVFCSCWIPELPGDNMIACVQIPPNMH